MTFDEVGLLDGDGVEIAGRGYARVKTSEMSNVFFPEALGDWGVVGYLVLYRRGLEAHRERLAAWRAVRKGDQVTFWHTPKPRPGPLYYCPHCGRGVYAEHDE